MIKKMTMMIKRKKAVPILIGKRGEMICALNSEEDAVYTYKSSSKRADLTMIERCGFEEAFCQKTMQRNADSFCQSSLLKAHETENDEQLNLAAMSLCWPRSSDVKVILRPRELWNLH